MTNTLNSNCHVPVPLLFNCLKHHAGYIARFISRFSSRSLPLLKEHLSAIGKSQMDLYTGNLEPHEISLEIKDFLHARKLLDEESYLQWLAASGVKYRETKLSDESVWVLLPGKIAGRHVHIHPGRYSPFTIRVRSETLRTAIAVLIYCRLHGGNCHSLAVVNEAREGLLDLSPVKEVSTRRGLGRMIVILEQKVPAE